ncbi:putative fe(3+)-transporting ATPase [Mycobacterium ulcerans str. Harvey]|uniref:Fe(3+)-transporting ATPase n=1 Tax=Mycobacterium ulcerans str. Harvey TaxID=1299332 RepID=A0ABP3ABI4_MYCUL|nr:putative fe(3+)-transporting ATPase [Mycobacterium ulcerans str. Harvey]
MNQSNHPAIALRGARLAFGDRVLWEDLDLSVSRGEFIAVLGPNGTGKTSLLKVLLGELALSAGVALVDGARLDTGRTRRGHIGYVPQHHPIDREVMLRGRDLVGLGVDGCRWGAVALRSGERARRREAVQRALQQVGGERLADVRVGLMSGASCSGYASPRHWQATRRCCCAMNRYWPSTRPTPTWSPLCSIAVAGRPQPRSWWSPTRSTRSCRTWTGCSTWSTGDS